MAGLSDLQKQVVDMMLKDGFLNSGQIAKQIGLSKEYVDNYIKAKNESHIAETAV